MSNTVTTNAIHSIALDSPATQLPTVEITNEATGSIAQNSMSTSPLLGPNGNTYSPNSNFLQRKSKHAQRRIVAMNNSPALPAARSVLNSLSGSETNSSPLISPRPALEKQAVVINNTNTTPPALESTTQTPVLPATPTKPLAPKHHIKAAPAKPYLATDQRVSRWNKQELGKPLSPAVQFEEYYEWNANKTRKSPSKNVSKYNNNEQEFHNDMIMMHSLSKELDNFYHIGNTEKTKKEITEVSYKGNTPVELKKLKPVTVYTVPVEIKKADGQVIVGNMEWCVGDEKNCYHRYLKKFHNNQNWNTPDNPSLQHMENTYFQGRRNQLVNATPDTVNENVSIYQDLGVVRIKDLRLGVEITAYAKQKI